MSPGGASPSLTSAVYQRFLEAAQLPEAKQIDVPHMSDRSSGTDVDSQVDYSDANSYDDWAKTVIQNKKSCNEDHTVFSTAEEKSADLD